MDDDVFSARHYFINKIFMQILGVWPDQPLIVRILCPAFFISLNLSRIIPELRQLLRIRGNIDQAMEIIITTAVMFCSIAMLVSAGTKKEELSFLIERMRSDWKSLSKSPPLLTILEKYATEGHRITMTYLCTTIYIIMYGVTIGTITLGFTTFVFNIPTPLNESHPNNFMYNGDYGFDTEQYFYWILFHLYCIAWGCMTIYIGLDSILAIWVQHCCALFKIAGYHFKNRAEEQSIGLGNDRTFRSRNRKMLKNLFLCIRQHQAAILCVKIFKTIRFADQIECMFSMVIGFIGGLSMILLSILGVLLVADIHNPDHTIRFLVVLMGVMFHMHHLTLSGQNLINHSSEITKYAYSSNWFELSVEAQKLVILIIARAQKPCFLTAGKVYIINMENFSAVIKTSVSYFTMLTSIRE